MKKNQTSITYFGVKIYNEVPSNFKVLNSNKKFMKAMNNWIMSDHDEMCYKVSEWFK